MYDKSRNQVFLRNAIKFIELLQGQEDISDEDQEEEEHGAKEKK